VILLTLKKIKQMETKNTLELLITQKIKTFDVQSLIQLFSFLESIENVRTEVKKKEDFKNLQGALSHCKANSFDFIENKQLEKLLER